MAWSERQRRAFGLYLQETRQFARENDVRFNEARSDPELRYWRKVLRQQEQRVTDDKPVDRGPHSPYAEALQHLGYRRNYAWWNVGETEKVRERVRRART